MSRARVRRMCFDTESSYFWRSQWGWATADAVRAHYVERPLRFHAAVVFDDRRKQYSEFGPTEAHRVVALLGAADELVTVNGRACDLVVLEKVCGAELVELLHRIPHHDLLGWRWRYGVEELARAFLAGGYTDFETRRRTHFQRLLASGVSEFDAISIAKARIDVEFTYAIFQHYLASGDRECTYGVAQNDSQTLARSDGAEAG